jgi:hypothetical protein
MLESALGSDFGLGGEPAFDRTALYRLYVQSPTGLAFNYADGEARIGLDAQYTWLARRYHLDAALLNSRHLLAGLLAMGGRAKRDANLLALHAVWFPTEVDPGMARSIPLDVHFRGRADIALFRSEWGDPRARFVGFKGGRNDVNHAHLDLGSFVLDADGVRWAEDLGPDNYNLPDYFGAGRWGYYRLNNHSHNVITPGDALQDTKAVAPIVAFGSTPARAFAVADLSQVYPGAAKKILRGVALLDRSRVLVQDDIDGLAPGTALTWRMLTSAEVSVGAEGHATLRRDGRMLEAVILAPQGAKFSAKPATPPTRGENPNKGVTELAVNLPAAAAPTRIAVLLTPNGDHWPWQTTPPMLSEVSSW